MQHESMIYSFLDPVEFLNFEFRNRQKSNPKFTLRKWAMLLGYQNPSYLSHILKRERKLKIDVASKIAELFHLSGKERSYFELIVLNANCDSPVEKNLYGKLIRKVRPKQYWELDEFPMEKFEFASEWYHWAIIELFYLKDFFPDVKYVQARLGPAVSKKMVKESLEKLIELGFIVKNPDGTFRRGNDNPMFMKNIPSWAVRAYHKEMLEKAKEAIDRLPHDQRASRGTMVALSHASYLEAQKIVAEAHRKLLELSAVDDGEHVYHLNTTLFPVTKSLEEPLQ